MCGIFLFIGKSTNNFNSHYSNIKCRGPDDTRFLEKITDYGKVYMEFHRLQINDLSSNGMQPMTYITDNDCVLICNGEIYNCKELTQKYEFNMKSSSDCEIILHMFKRFGIEETVKQLDGVFAFALYDHETIYLARDIVGVRPLFYLWNGDEFIISSEAKSILSVDNINIDNEKNIIKQFPPGYFGKLTYNKNICNGILTFNTYTYFNLDRFKINPSTYKSCINTFKTLLTNAVKKRLLSDRPIGCFLSGGLDSSIICSLLCKLSDKKITTFSIGMENTNAPDLKYAKQVAEYLNTDHHEVKFTFNEGFAALEDLIFTLETYDITTIRAALPQYMLSKYILNNTDIKVVFSGEGADEHYAGYQYLHMAPNNNELHDETVSLLKNIHYFDVLRTDRTTAKFGLEVRVPFLDKRVVEHSLTIPPEYKESKNKIEKYIIRQAFIGNYLPEEILWRRKNAFSDAVGYGWVDELKKRIDLLINDDEFERKKEIYNINPPISKEALYYRNIFEKYYSGKGNFIPKFWMPNPNWCDNKLTDPSALVLDCFVEND